MNGKLPRITARQIIKVLEKSGFTLARQSGSHKIYKNSFGTAHLSHVFELSRSFDGDKTKITLTENGERKVLNYKLSEIKLKKGRWDGIWRIVIFDIPEKDRKGRNILRSKMQELGFYPLQKSVMVTPWKCKDEIDFIKHFYHLEDYVNLIHARIFDGEDVVRGYFELD